MMTSSNASESIFQTNDDGIKSVELRTTKLHPPQQKLTRRQKSALQEIVEFLKAICEPLMYPLALTWTPRCLDGENRSGRENEGVIELHRRKEMLCVQEFASYVTNTDMLGFMHACCEHPLERGQGIVGRALQTNVPAFCENVQAYEIGSYPLAHHARKFGLKAAVAIKIRSSYTGTDDYIVEFFLPPNCGLEIGSQLLIESISMALRSRNLRAFLGRSMIAGSDMANRANTSNYNELTGMAPAITTTGEHASVSHLQSKPCSSRHTENKRSATRKNISKDVLKNCYSGSIKDVAKSIGVSTTTLKKKCRQLGIPRWPSRKIRKVNSSFKKIEKVIKSVPGMEGTVGYDPATWCLAAVTSLPSSSGAVHMASTQHQKQKGLLEALNHLRAIQLQ